MEIKKGDKVRANGERLARGAHFHRTAPEMERWEEEGTILEVVDVVSDTRITCGDGKDTYSYHPGEVELVKEKKASRGELLEEAYSLLDQLNEVVSILKEAGVQVEVWKDASSLKITTRYPLC